jgi:CDP-diacylglycerol--glycerol-3-phosphate 3-phosphatidyltransferase
VSEERARPKLVVGVPDHVGDPIGSPSAINVPNALTVLRLLLVPVFAWLLLRDGGTDSASRTWSAVVFAFASFTDLIDGELARRRGQVTNFGKVADPIADKALTGTALVGLSYLGELPWWITLVILAREIGVTLLRFWVIQHGVIPASRGGKVKTAAQVLAILLYLLPVPSWLLWARAASIAVALILTVATGIDYAGRALRLRRADKAAA